MAKTRDEFIKEHITSRIVYNGSTRYMWIEEPPVPKKVMDVLDKVIQEAREDERKKMIKMLGEHVSANNIDMIHVNLDQLSQQKV